jgi:iron complex outermembrane receptor protein
MKTRSLILSCTALAALTAPNAVWAQSSAEGAQEGLSDIVVTARRTEESLQDVPVAVTGYTTEELAALDIGGFGDIGKTVPNLDVQRQFGSASAPIFYLRGVSTGSLKFETDAGIGLYIDGIYLGRPAGTAFDLADVERVEVLRGPQGTLFGRNSTGGAINFVTAAPSGEFGVKASGTVGNYDRYKGQVTVNLPALGPISARISYLHDQNTGYVDNLTPGRTFKFAAPFETVRSAKSFGAENTDAISLALRLDLGAFKADYKFDYTDKVSTQLGTQVLSAFNPGFLPGTTGVFVGGTTERLNALALDFTTPSKLKIQGHSLTLAYDMSDEITLKSISGYRKLNEFVGGNDIDGGAFVQAGVPYTFISSIQDRNQKQFTQEVQLLGATGKLDWVLGGFYFRETGNDNNPVFLGTQFPASGTIVPVNGLAGNTVNTFGVPSDYLAGADVSVRNRSLAGYAHLAYKMDQFELAGGVRYSKDNRFEFIRAAGLRPFVPGFAAAGFDASSDNWDFDATATYIANSDVRAYLRFATGYLSGGVLGGTKFKAETIKSYEAGIKADVLDDRLRINAAFFVSRRKDIQTLAFAATSGTFLLNSPTGKEHGFELEMVAKPSDNFTFNATYGYLNQKLADDPVSGKVNSLAPKNTLSVGGQYESSRFSNDSMLQFRVDGFFKDKRLSDPVAASTNQFTILQSHFDLNARLSLVDLPIGSTKMRVSAWVQNLTDNQELEFARNVNGLDLGTFQIPRTYGVEIGFQF